MKILTLIPARSGSKGLPGKNIRALNGKPLLYWPIKAAMEFGRQERIVCSTDSVEIGKIASEAGALVPFIRPKELAEDNTPIIDVLKHTLDMELQSGRHYSHLLLLQPTSPTVKSSDMHEAVELMKTRAADTIITGYKYRGPNLEKMYKQNNYGRVFPVEDIGAFEAQRQDYGEVFIRTGLLYLTSTETILGGGLYGNRVSSVEVGEERAITIDTIDDFLAAEQYLGRAVIT